MANVNGIICNNPMPNDRFGCAMGDMGSQFAGFLNIFGDPAASFMFFILVAGFIVLLFVAIKRVTE